MPKEVMETIEKQTEIPIATASLDGTPNVAFVGFLKVLNDETIMISDNFFKKTAANLKNNPRIAFVVYDGYTKKSYQIKGSVKIDISGDYYNAMVGWVDSIMPDLPKKAAVIVHVEEVYDSQPGPNAGEKIV